jgi:D-alanyl-lipoteichoic acid acyltransferase DltB (MBOAT superfamily)
MAFRGGTYFVFLILVFFAYWLIAERVRWRILLLAAASCFFYWQAGGGALLLLLSISIIDFTTTRLMARAENRSKRKALLCVSLVVEIGALSVFKYADFFIETGASAISLLGIETPAARPGLLAPIGISFFIFQSMAYVLDVYRKDGEPAPGYPDYLAFITFFPTIVAGPILRAKQLLPHLRSRLKLDAETGGQALFLIAVGLIKKVAIADYLSANLVDRVFDFPERFSSLEVLGAVYAYALQIYADFSGYSDIAIGSAMLLGFTLPINFSAPYRSRDLTEFWRRWHISLSTWLRDYVFFSIVESRRSASLYAGMILTMLIGGIWHGPGWTFVIWGLLHGVGLAAARAFAGLRRRSSTGLLSAEWPSLIGILITFHFVCFAWVFFRAETVGQAVSVLYQLSGLTMSASNLAWPVVLVMIVGFLAHWTPDRVWDRAKYEFARLPAFGQACILFALAVGLYFVASADVVPFIYSRF